MNNILAMVNVIEKGAGVGVLPDYVIREESPLSRLELGADMPNVRLLARLPGRNEECRARMAFRDFLVANAPLWREV